MSVDAVLGLSMTPTSVGMVLVNGTDADGASVDNNAFDVRDNSIQTSAQATAAVLRTEALAASRGVRLHSIGVTWSENADAEASQLIRSLSESGFDNVVAVRLPEATEALARGIADVIGYETTAVCVIEPDVVIALVVHTRDGAVQTAVNHAITSDEGLISWLSSVFTKADWQPEALVVVGSAGGFESILPRLESALSVPAFAPEDAQLALARGAALASAQSTDFSLLDLERDLDDGSVDDDRNAGGHRSNSDEARGSRRLAQAGPLVVLVVAAVTFVVSASIAVTLELSPRRDSGPVNPTSAAVDAQDRPAAARTIPSPAAVPPARSIAPPDVVPSSEEAPLSPPDAPLADEAPPQGETIPGGEPSVQTAPSPTADPASAPPSPNPYVPPPVGSPVQPKKESLHSRIMDRIRGIGASDPAEVAPDTTVIQPPPTTP